MITHCPFCLTHFRIRPEQLSVRAGQVRCGKCSRVFDASEQLIEEAAPAPAQERPVAGAAMAAEAAPAKAMQAGADAQATAASARAAADTAQAGASVPDDAAIPEPAEAPSAGVETGVEPDADAFDFGPIAATADTSGRARRWPWLLGSLLLLAVLLAQAAYYYRSALIVLFPQAKPYATELCARLGCDLPLPRRIELMSIEASDLQADTANPNIMVLSATLKNRAVFNQQLPLLELTLTDAQDQPVVRRVLAPRDYAGKAADAQAGFAARTEIAIKVFIEASQVKATGYRLYLFYP
jgi:predicted Zn finger-like uncharacterized protein